MEKEITLTRSSKDYYGRENITIKINNEDVEIPLQILKDFVLNDEVKESCIFNSRVNLIYRKEINY